MTIVPFRTSRAGLAAALLLATALPALAAPPETPETFVRRVYALYRTGGPGVPTDRPGGTPFYTAALLDAFATEEKLAHGEVGAIDGDPICDCQDFGKVRVKTVAVTPGEADTVKARVDFTNFGSKQIVTLTLSRTPAGWRIADVANSGMKSVMSVLQDAIAHPVQEEKPKP